MQRICSRSKLIGRNTLRQAVLRGENGSKNAEFADQFVGRVDDRLETLGFRLVGHDPVEDNLVLKVQAPIDPVAEAVAGYAGSQSKEIINLASKTVDLVRYFFQDLRFKEGAEFRLGSFQSNRLGSDFDLLRNIASLQRGIHAGVPADVHRNIPADPVFKTGFLDAYRVAAGDQVDHREGPCRTGDGGVNYVRGVVRYSYLGVRNHSSGFIGDRAGDAA